MALQMPHCFKGRKFVRAHQHVDVKLPRVGGNEAWMLFREVRRLGSAACACRVNLITAIS